MAHSMERCLFNTIMATNGKIGLYTGDVRKITDDLAILKPTLFVTVPRLYNKMYDAIQKKLGEKKGLIKSLIDKGVKTKLKNLHKKGKTKHWFYDMLVFNKIKKKLGGRVRIMATGSAPISEEVIDFMKIAFQAPIIEGYGQTEGNSYEFATDVKDGVSGHVGGPFTHNEFKLVDVPEMNYTNKDVNEKGEHAPRGEIWVRGPNIIPGYYKLDEKNKETFTEDGWLLSGDIGTILPGNNALKIIDRKKNIFKLAQGEYIAPEKLESAYQNASNYVNEIFVYGDSLKSCLVAIVNVEGENLPKLIQEVGLPEGTSSEDPELKKKIIEKFNEIQKQEKFNSLEKIKDIWIETRNWQDLDLITSSFKKKRYNLKEFYLENINQMYEKLY